MMIHHIKIKWNLSTFVFITPVW